MPREPIGETMRDPGLRLTAKKCSKIWMSRRISNRCRSHRMKQSVYKFKNEAMWMVPSLSIAKQTETASHNKFKLFI